MIGVVLQPLIVMQQGHRPAAASQSDGVDQLRRLAQRLMTELQQLRSVHKQRFININTVSHQY